MFTPVTRPARLLSGMAALLLAATGAAGVSASAAPFESNGRTFAVDFSDLDLAKPADRRLLDRRIARAAAKVCPDSDLGRAAKCRAEAIAHVQAPIDQAIARAATREVYADASRNQLILGN